MLTNYPLDTQAVMIVAISAAILYLPEILTLSFSKNSKKQTYEVKRYNNNQNMKIPRGWKREERDENL